MEDKKVTDMEMSAILEAFAQSRDEKAVSIRQSKTFKALIIFCNIYVLSFIFIYFMLWNKMLVAVDPNLLSTDILTIFNGRANIMFWLLILMNIGAYFNFAFKILCLIALVYLLNSTIDNAVLFSGLFSVDDRPYFSVFIMSRPMFFVALAWMGLSYSDSLEGD
jgi:hypothetical protein